MPEKKKKILVAAHDAGGAEILAAMIASERNNFQWHLVCPMECPAYDTFGRRGLLDLYRSPETAEQDLIDRNYDYLFVGTGKSGFEFPFIKQAGVSEIPSMAFLEHWVNYRERFAYPEPGWEQHLPEFTAVSDQLAYSIAQSLGCFKLLKVRNYYIEELRGKYPEEKNENSMGKILFLSEAIEEHCQNQYHDPRRLGFTQTDLIEGLLDRHRVLAQRFGAERITIRLHPYEPTGKYDYLREKYDDIDLILENPRDRDLNDSLASSEIVFGIDGMALLIAHLLGKKAFSILPKGIQSTIPLPSENCLNGFEDLENIKPSIKTSNGLEFYPDQTIDKLLEAIENHACENCRDH